jgi:transcriptional regulator with XRE-family HTH domain
MSTNPPPDPKTSMWAFIAFHLRFCRNQRKLNGDELGKIINCSKATVSRIENGETRLDEIQASSLDGEWATGGLFTLMVWYARLGHDPDWFREHVSYEARALELKIYELALIPGLFQTEAYARSLMEVAGVEDVDTQVAARMARKEILERRPRPQLWVLLTQSVLDWPYGGPEVMREQLAHLLELALRPNMSIRVIPRFAGSHIGVDGAFKVLRVAEGDVAYTEAHGGGRLILSTEEVRTFATRYDRIGAKALNEDSSRSLIEQVMEAMR